MRRLVAVVAAVCVAAGVAGAPTSGAATGLPMTVTRLGVGSGLVRFPVYDAAGTLLREETYRVTSAGGNCCEKYVAATADGRLLELGGGYPTHSPDGGVTWYQAAPPVPLLNGEGAVTVAPNGDIVGVAWDVLTGDRLVAYKFTAADGTWRYHENPLHGPFFDRPWVTVVEGPFTAGTTTAPYLSIVRGGGGLERDVELVSYDGLVYTEVAATSPVAGLLDARTGPLPVVADADTDLLQPHAQSRVSPLPGFGAVRRQEGGVLCRSRLQVLEPDRRWSCLDLGAEVFTGDVRADGRGRLHEVRYATSAVTYRVSTDGGATWAATTYPLPGPAPSIAGTRPDVKVDSARSLTYVALRVAGTGTGGQQDMVLRFDHAGGVPSLREVFHLGRGDLVVGSVFGDAGPRMDFASIALLPGGRFAVAYDDTTTRVGTEIRPWLAIQQ